MMNNVIITGSGRSGTSLAAGMLAGAGYFMGRDMIGPTPGNPKGYFESHDIEQLNEAILRTVVPAKPQTRCALRRWWYRRRPGKAHFWLAQLDPRITPHSSPAGDQQIQSLLATQPFCFKDPRFSYTLPIWRPHLPDRTVFVCVFRHPAVTVQSILTECRREPYLKDLRFGRKDGLRVWERMYRHILEKHRAHGRWLFLHFDQAFTPEGMDRLEEHTGARIDRAFPESRYRRSTASGRISDELMGIYRQLCDLAGHDEPAD